MAERASRSPSHVRQRAMTAAIKAAEAAGKEVVRVEIEPGGKVVIITSRNGDEQREDNPWDRAFG